MRNSTFSEPASESSMICQEITIPAYLMQSYMESEGNNIFEKFYSNISCKCCNRHQIKKPTTIYLPFGHSNTVSPDAQYPCMCPCRHRARAFNRLYTSQFTEKINEDCF